MRASQTKLMNEFDGLLKYLEKHKKPEKKIQPKDIKVVDTKNKNDQKKIKPEKIKYNSTKETGFDVKYFESLMRQKLVGEALNLRNYERPYISVTELITCLRKVYYQRKHYNIDLNSQYSFSYVSLITNIGDSVHNFIQDIYDFDEVEKTIISKTYKVKGRIDGIKNNFLIELKTIADDKFNNTYIDDHYHQSIIYANILNNEYDYNINTITLVYILRNLKQIYTFDLPYSQSKSTSFLENAKVVLDSLSSNKIPEPINATKEQCKFCKYLKYCATDGSTKIELPFNKKTNDILEQNNLNDAIFLL